MQALQEQLENLKLLEKLQTAIDCSEQPINWHTLADPGGTLH